MRRSTFPARPGRGFTTLRGRLVLALVTTLSFALLAGFLLTSGSSRGSMPEMKLAQGGLPPASTAAYATSTSGMMIAPSRMEASTPAMAAGATGAGEADNLSRGYEGAPATGGTAPDSIVPPRPVNPALSTYQSSLTAGQVDDNAKFQEYVTYLHNYGQQDVLPIAVDRRQFVRVLDSNQQSVAGARVQLFAGQQPVFDGRTMSDGRTLFLPQQAEAAQVQQYRAVISRGNAQTEAKIAVGTSDPVVTLPDVSDNSGAVGLDIVFLLDATGSMGDEISAVKSTIGSIASRIEQLPGSSAPRFGLVAFRDQNDAYVTRQWDFANVRDFAANLDNVQAGGGGDYPEDVDAGLAAAIRLPGWAGADSGRHLRMIILVGDAPPHLDYSNSPAYPQLLQEASAAGIKIFPIGASGLTDQGEYIFRQFAQVTQGQFVFLTYANGVAGASGPATDKHVTGYSVNNLDSLVVNLVAGEVANQTGQHVETLAPHVILVVNNVVTPGAADSGLAAFLNLSRRQVSAFLDQWSALLWLLVIAIAVLAARRAPARARHTPAAIPFATTADPAPLKARAAIEPPALAASLAPAAPVAYVVGGAAGRPTAPLPPL